MCSREFYYSCSYMMNTLLAKTSALIFILLLLFTGCSNDKPQFENAGGSLTMALENEPSTFSAKDVRDYYSATVLTQIHEGLVAFDPATLKIVPKIAESWTRSDDGKSYTFEIRDNIYFHEHEVFSGKEDRKLTPLDVVTSFELACKKGADGMESSAYSTIFKGLLVGADDYMVGKAESIKGIHVSGNRITLNLLYEDHNFLNKLANVNVFIVSHKVAETNDPEIVVGTGPFMYGNYTTGKNASMVLLKNPDYYLDDNEGNALPYLDSLIFLFQSQKMEQLDMFEAGELDLIIGLPTSRITRMLEGKIEDFNSVPPKLILANNPLLQSHFYYFNMEDERFKDVRVRKAFNFAVDREALGRDVLKNQYYDLGHYGVTPPVGKALKGYDFNEVQENGYRYDPEEARRLLAEAGYPEGKGFGSVQLRYNINDIHSAVADEFSKQIHKVLGINVNIDGSSFERLNEDGNTGKGDIFRMGWTADYPSPETFLMNFYGGYVPKEVNESSPINKSRYVNEKFDDYYEKAISSTKMGDQMRNFTLAEAELMKNPPVIPLWYTGDIEIKQSYLRNFHFNALNYLDFTNVYIKKWTMEEYQKAFPSKNN